jgi:hypothetical protein
MDEHVRWLEIWVVWLKLTQNEMLDAPQTAKQSPPSIATSLMTILTTIYIVCG